MKPRKVLILGSGALKIGEAGEFDYSGSQALKALKEEGIKSILINPNIATIQTSHNLADKIYLLPVKPFFVEKVIEKEKPDAIMLSFGGQTALNCGISLFKSGILEKHKVKVLGTPIESIIITEDRALFKKAMNEISIDVPKSITCNNEVEAINAAKNIGFPVIIRSGFALGGEGSAVIFNEKQLIDSLKNAFSKSKQVLIEEYLHGWKEIEYEIVRDNNDNCIAVCNMENIDPLGIHTGESIVVAPSQTLTNEEYHLLRRTALKIVRQLNIIGECNVQYALNPVSKEFKVIEVNARLSRSSALASKATGYPLAYIAAKLALNKVLPYLLNSVTKSTTACFEPALDYVVIKMPVWDFNKFFYVKTVIGSEMKSVGEVMAIGRTFEEALQKAVRMCGYKGLLDESVKFDSIFSELKNPTDKRLFAIAKAIYSNKSLDLIYELTRIDKFFLFKIKKIVDFEKKLKGKKLDSIKKEILLEAKKLGFSDERIAFLLKSNEKKVRRKRLKLKIKPFVKQIDTLAAEYPAKTNYLYLTYNATENDIEFKDKRQALVLGSGAYRIGSSVEFDYCSVNAAESLKKHGFNSIMLNFNPETVSTDYDVCSKLYFDEISLERVLDICEKEKPDFVVVSFGGQTANNLALKLSIEGIKILGTKAKDIDKAEDRNKFSLLCDSLRIRQPAWIEAKSLKKALNFSRKNGFPVLVRPSYVLSGLGMSVVYTEKELKQLLEKAALISREHPVVISKFIENAKEFDFDAVALKGKIMCFAFSEHIEKAGVHSGDSTMVFPSQKINNETKKEALKVASLLAKALKVSGPFNVQFLAKDNKLQVIECNLRCSRSFPFVSKVSGINFIDVAINSMLGLKSQAIGDASKNLKHVAVKVPQFSFSRLKRADPVLYVQMASTGEVACIDSTLYKALFKSLIATGFPLKVKGILLSFSSSPTAQKIMKTLKDFEGNGFKFYALSRTARLFKENNIKNFIQLKSMFDPSMQFDKMLSSKKINLVISLPDRLSLEELEKDYTMRRKAADYSIPIITEASLAKKVFRTILKTKPEDLSIKALNEYF